MAFYIIHYVDQSGAAQCLKEGADDQTAAETKAAQIVAQLGGTLVRVVDISQGFSPKNP